MKIEELAKLEVNFYDKKAYVIHTINLKQASNHKLVSQKA